MTGAQLQILQHSLGLDQYGLRDGLMEMTRNHFCAGAEDEPDCRDLVAMGYMRQHLTTDATDVFPYFNCSVTEEGKAAMIKESPAPPQLTRSQKRYRSYLKADTGESFGQWLKDQSAGANL